MDWLPPETRRKVMQAIRSKDTKPEVALRSGLFAQGFRYRKHSRHLSGSPDLVLPRFKAVIFVHGCFWHAHGCSAASRPTSNTNYWHTKLNRTMQRDREVQARLLADGWRVAVVWECALPRRHPERLSAAVTEVARWIRSDERCLVLGNTPVEAKDRARADDGIS